MNSTTQLSIEKKLTVIFRVESGCLGPDGKQLVKEFCELAQSEVESVDSNFINWVITPRTDKSQPEMQFEISGKTLTPDKAEKYLCLFDVKLDVLESELFEKITDLVDQYLGRDTTS